MPPKRNNSRKPGSRRFNLNQSNKPPQSIETAVEHTFIQQCPGEDLEQRLERIHGYKPRPGQLEVIKAIDEDEKDVVLIAKTGYGKSMIFHSIPMLGKGKIALILMPLNALQDDQLESIRQLNNGGIPAKPCVVNSKTKTPALLKAIRRGEYTHIMTSPELALDAGSKSIVTDSFRTVLCSQEFQTRIGFLAVDEAHIVEAWGHEFREAYGRIGELRSILPRNLSLFATSATLDTSILQKVIKSLRLREDHLLIKRESLDREDIFFNAQAIQNSFGSFQDLRFLVKPCNGRILKQVVYGDSVADLTNMGRQLRIFYRQIHGCTAEEAKAVIRIYYARLSEGLKGRILQEFKKEDSRIRIICATDALGMGINIPDIDRVCQWREPRSLRELMQRGGRAARRQDRRGEVIYLFSSNLRGEKTPPNGPGPSHLRESQQIDDVSDEANHASESDDSSQSHTTSSKAEVSKQNRKKTDYEKRQRLDIGLYEYINEPCSRRAILRYFSDEDNMASFYPNGCCSKCSREQGTTSDYIKECAEPKLKKPRKKRIFQKGSCIQKLETWRQRIGRERFTHTMSVRTDCFDFFLDRETIDELLFDCLNLKTGDDVAMIIPYWPWIDEYKDELLACIQEGIRDASSQASERRPTPETQINVHTTYLEARISTPLAIRPLQSPQNSASIIIQPSMTNMTSVISSQQSFETNKSPDYIIDCSTDGSVAPTSLTSAPRVKKRRKAESSDTLLYQNMVSPLRYTPHIYEFERIRANEPKFSPSGRKRRETVKKSQALKVLAREKGDISGSLASSVRRKRKGINSR